MGDLAAYFLSDAHLGKNLPYDPQREHRLLDLLSTIEKDAAHLIILGDLFDFWIEYPSAIRSDYFMILHALRRLVDRGTEVHYMAGNHDFALGDFLTRTIGVTVHPDSWEPRLQGKRLFIHHGDGLLKTDFAYHAIKRLLRNQTNQKIYKLLHPTLGIAIASYFSLKSRNSHKPDEIEKRVLDYRGKAKAMIDSGYDWVFLGHTHRPELTRWRAGGYCNTGDWLIHNTFAEMRGGIVCLWRYQDNGKHLPFEPDGFPPGKKSQ